MSCGLSDSKGKSEKDLPVKKAVFAEKAFNFTIYHRGLFHMFLYTSFSPPHVGWRGNWKNQTIR